MCCLFCSFWCICARYKLSRHLLDDKIATNDHCDLLSVSYNSPVTMSYLCPPSKPSFIHAKPESVFYADCSKSRVALAGIEHPRPMDEGKPVRLTFRSKVYLPPELRAPTPTAHHISPATDVWSLGLLLYQM